jgi:T-complex protein 1 subunit eta
MDAKWNIIYEKLDKCVNIGAKIVLSHLTNWRSWHLIFCRSRCILCRPCDEEDLQWVARAIGGSIQTIVNNIIPEVIL